MFVRRRALVQLRDATYELLAEVAELRARVDYLEGELLRLNASKETELP